MITPSLNVNHNQYIRNDKSDFEDMNQSASNNESDQMMQKINQRNYKDVNNE